MEREKINFPFPFLSSRRHFTPSAFFLSLSNFPFLFLTLWTSALSISISTSLPHRSIRKKFKLRNGATVVLSPKAFFVPFLPDLFSCFLWMTEQARDNTEWKSAPRDCMLSDRASWGRERKFIRRGFWRNVRKKRGNLWWPAAREEIAERGF